MKRKNGVYFLSTRIALHSSVQWFSKLCTTDVGYRRGRVVTAKQHPWPVPNPPVTLLQEAELVGSLFLCVIITGMSRSGEVL